MRVQTARNAAERLVEKMGIAEPPVDPMEIARRLGLHVGEKDLGQGISGVLINNGPSEVYIVVSAGDRHVRKRFTVAHEIGHQQLGHLVGGEHVHVDKTRQVLFRGPRAAEGVDIQEIEANTYAASLLMPTKLLQKAVADRRLLDEDVEDLAKRFDVSAQAMTFRLTHLGLLGY
jgi:predicted transcriptional regulator